MARLVIEPQAWEAIGPELHAQFKKYATVFVEENRVVLMTEDLTQEQLNEALWAGYFDSTPPEEDAMSNTNETIKKLAEKLKQAGIAGKDDFAKGVKDAAIEGAQDLLKAGPDVAGRYARTTLDMAALLADEALTGKHEPREWAQIDSQFSSQNTQSAAILRAASLKFLKNVASILGGVLGGLGGTVGEAVAGTLDDLLKNIG